jgi:hypothetical protein
MNFTNSDLAQAFPSSLREDALCVASALPQPAWDLRIFFSARVGNEAVTIPYRIYHNPAFVNPAQLAPPQVELLDCLLTRHHDGFVREERLGKIICVNHEWIPPFVVQLAGEYVAEILNVIRDNLRNLDPQLYRRFLKGNDAFLALTKQRVISYWNCYYRGQAREDYPGFRIMEFFDHLIAHDRE